MSFAPDGHPLARASTDKTGRLRNVATGTELRCLEGHGSSVCAVNFAPDGRALASGGDDNTVRLWDAATGDCLACFPMCADTVLALWFDPKVPRPLAAAGKVARTPLVYRLDLIRIVPGDTWQIPSPPDD